MDKYGWAIEELALSGEVGLGDSSISTVYRWAREINRRLDHENYDWRVKVNDKARSLYQVSVDHYKEHSRGKYLFAVVRTTATYDRSGDDPVLSTYLVALFDRKQKADDLCKQLKDTAEREKAVATARYKREFKKLQESWVPTSSQPVNPYKTLLDGPDSLWEGEYTTFVEVVTVPANKPLEKEIKF